MRTQVQFCRIHREAVHFIKLHTKCVWIVPTENNYCLSIVEPKPEELPWGTQAIEVGPPIVDGSYTIQTELPSIK
ncbi:hypothetical protein A8V38_13605 [Vibrio parahaemolyticus]|nr:hypothetical protein [Vibrio parahaemolyticus]